MEIIGHNPTLGGYRIKRSDTGIDLVRLLAEQGLRIFSVEQAREYSAQAGINEAYLVEALYHLRQTGWIVALRRGLYAITSALPGVPPVHEFDIAMALTRPAAISHWSALHHHGLTEQAPRDVFVLTTTGHAVPRQRDTKEAGDRSGVVMGDVRYRFVQLNPKRFFGFDKAWVGDAQVIVTDPERTLLDGLSMPQYCGDFAEVLHAFQVRAAQLDTKKIVDYALRLDMATVKRLGWVLERQGIAPKDVQPLLEVPVTSYRKLDPTGPRSGKYDARWMIQENLPGKVGM